MSRGIRGGALLSRRLLAAVAFATLAASASRAADEVVLTKKDKNGENVVQTGIVETDNREGVRLKMAGPGGGGAVLAFSLDNVVEVRYERTPYYYWNAKEQLEQGVFDKALANYDQILEREKANFNPLLLQYILYQKAQCLVGLDKNAEAIATYEQLLKDVPDTRFFTDAIVKVVETYIRMENWAKAEEWLPKLSQAGDKYKPMAQLYSGKVLEAKKKYSEAKDVYNNLASTETGDVKFESYVGIARCELAAKRYDAAKASAKKAIGDGEASPEVLAAAYLVLGDATLTPAEQSQDKDKISEALFAYLRVIVLYNGFPETEPESLLKAGMCFEYLKGPKDRGRAKEMYTKLIQKYPKAAQVEAAKIRIPRL